MQGNRAIARAAYVAGRALYGDDLVHRSATIKYRNISTRVQSMLEAGCASSCAGLVDDFEYAFTLDGVGIEASGDALTDPHLARGEFVCLYDPEFGIDLLVVDMTTEEMYKMINNYREG